VDSDVLGREVWVCSELQTSFIEGVVPLLSYGTTLAPDLVRSEELLLADRHSIAALGAIAVDEDVAHVSC